jgi:hypothetical protein
MIELISRISRVSSISRVSVLTLFSVVLCVESQEPGWMIGTATYYTGIDDLLGGYAGSCGFKDLSRALGGMQESKYGPHFAAASEKIYKSGAGCGACFELKCIGNPVCTKDSVVVTITDSCPFKGNEQWCGPDKNHFDLSGRTFSKLVSTMAAGHFALQWRRTPCKRSGPPVISIEGNRFWQSIRALNLADGGTYDSLLIRGAGAGGYTPLRRDWGTSFVHEGEITAPISVKLQGTEGELELSDCIPGGWITGSEYACKGGATIKDPSTRRLTIQDTKERLRCDCTCTPRGT